MALEKLITSLREYKLVKKLQEGGQGRVELWRHAKTGELVAVKTSTSSTTSIIYNNMKSERSRILATGRRRRRRTYSSEYNHTLETFPLAWESKILTELHQHNVPGVVPFKGSILSEKSKQIILGYCDRGDVFELIRRKTQKRLGEAEACRIIKGLLHTLRCCHALGITHRDIKPENLFVMSNASYKKYSIQSGDREIQPCHRKRLRSSFKRKSTIDKLIGDEAAQYSKEIHDEDSMYDYHVVLGDFGLATYFDKSYNGQLGLSLDCGTLDYMAPEVILRKYDERADVWSLGVVLHYLLTGVLPFKDNSDDKGRLKYKIMCEDLDVFGSSLYAHLSYLVRDLLIRMLDKNPKTRITIKEIKNHAWIKNLGIRRCVKSVAIHPSSSSPSFKKRMYNFEPSSNSSSPVKRICFGMCEIKDLPKDFRQLNGNNIT